MNPLRAINIVMTLMISFGIKAGFRRLQILEGGVDAWAQKIDPTLARY